MKTDVMAAISDGPVCLLDVRGVEEEQVTFPENVEKKRPARKVTMRRYYCEFPTSGKQLQVVEWPDRETGALLACKVKRGDKACFRVRTLGEDKGVLSATFGSIID